MRVPYSNNTVPGSLQPRKEGSTFTTDATPNSPPLRAWQVPQLVLVADGAAELLEKGHQQPHSGHEGHCCSQL